MIRDLLYIICIVILSSNANAQVGIGTSDPKATLEIVAQNDPNTVDGILIPRVTRERIKSMTGMLNSNLVFVNDITGFEITNPNDGPVGFESIASQVDSPGFYFYQANSGNWVKMPSYEDVTNYFNKNSYWAEQYRNTSSPRVSNDPESSGVVANNTVTNTESSKVIADIYQKGKVGIGYSNALGIDFNVNKTQKQLEVGGDFRTSHFSPSNSYYYGFETNSLALPSSFQSRGNVLYSAKSKDLEDFSYFSRPYDGNMMIQTDDKLIILSRTGQSNTTNGAKAYENQMSSLGTVEFLYNSTPNPDNEYQYLQTFDTSGFGVSDYNRSDVAFGLDFNKNKFYIGNNLDNGDGYFFPTRKGNSGQILKLNNNRELVWSDITNQSTSSSPQFFYMPSIVLPINGVNSTYVTYNSSNQTYTVDLYAAFKSQFDLPIKSSNGTATGLQGFVLSRDAYEYHIIYADNTVFPHNDIVFSTVAGEEGKFTYKVNSATIVNSAAFMNIVLKVK